MTHRVKEKGLRMYRKIGVYLCLLIVCCVISVVSNRKLVKTFQKQSLSQDLILSDLFRKQNVGDKMLESLEGKNKVGAMVAEYLLEEEFGYSFWREDDKWKEFFEYTTAIWDDVKYFPIPQFPSDSSLKTSYVNTWMSERTYGGKRGHEGTDIMASKNQRGIYPIVSMTDGIVSQKGWLEKGGYRIGVTTMAGAYFYYAHLESYSHVEIGDRVKAGDILGYMGDSGYGKEGPVGKFAVHLHLGIYIYPSGKEVSINPYWVLRYIEKQRVKCYTNM